MCEICIKIFNKSENRDIARKSRGRGWQIFFLQGGLGVWGVWKKFAVQGGAEPLGGARNSRGG